MSRALLLVTCGWALIGCPKPSTIPVGFNQEGLFDVATKDARRGLVLSITDDLHKRSLRLVANGQTPGLAVGVVLDEELVWWGGYGVSDVAKRTGIDQSSVFRIASLTKPFTALCVLHLRDQGILSLDAPVTTWIPELEAASRFTNDSPAITLRHLITHTSGLPRLGGIDYVSRPDTDLPEAEVLKAATTAKRTFSPGTDVLYSNLAVGLVGIIIQRATGKTYREVLRATILAPLGMVATSLEPPASGLARGYQRNGERFVPRHHWRIGAAEAMGGMYSNLADMARWAGLQQSAWPPRNGRDDGPVKRSTIRESQRILGFGRLGKAVFGAGWGIGAGSQGLFLGHTGSTWQYASAVRIYPEDGIGVIALANGGPSGPLADLVGPAADGLVRGVVAARLHRGAAILRAIKLPDLKR